MSVTYSSALSSSFVSAISLLLSKGSLAVRNTLWILSSVFHSYMCLNALLYSRQYKEKLKARAKTFKS